MFEGEKTRVFWWGLIIFGLAIVGLFGVVWYTFVLNYSYWYSSYGWRYVTPLILGGAVFMLIGFYMMKSGVKKEKESET
jgi:hypothetical protein